MIKKLVERLENSSEFAEWRKKNQDSYFTSAFFMTSEVMSDWVLSYYSKKEDRITSFTVGKEIRLNATEEVFKKKGIVKEFDLSKLKIDFEKAVELADEYQKKHYPKELPAKKVIICQNLNMGQVWNITYITTTFNTLNMKFSTENGKILKHELNSLFDLPKK